VLVDVSVSMVEEERGGPSGFLRVKDRINQVVSALDEGAFFGVVVFADAAKTWNEKMLIANDKNKEGVKRWLRPFNTEGNWGLKSGNIYASTEGLQATGGTTRLDLALTGAFQQGADTILIISDGLPRVEKPVDAQRMAEHDRQYAAWRKKNSGKLNEWENSDLVEQKVWVPGHDGKLKEGRAAGPKKGHWVVKKVRRNRRPQGPKTPEKVYWSLNEFIEHFEKLNEALYAKKGRKPPVVHCIGYQIDREGSEFLRKLAHHYKGRYRRVARLR